MSKPEDNTNVDLVQELNETSDKELVYLEVLNRPDIAQETVRLNRLKIAMVSASLAMLVSAGEGIYDSYSDQGQPAEPKSELYQTWERARKPFVGITFFVAIGAGNSFLRGNHTHSDKIDSLVAERLSQDNNNGPT